MYSVIWLQMIYFMELLLSIFINKNIQQSNMNYVEFMQSIVFGIQV